MNPDSRELKLIQRLGVFQEKHTSSFPRMRESRNTDAVSQELSLDAHFYGHDGRFLLASQ